MRLSAARIAARIAGLGLIAAFACNLEKVTGPRSSVTSVTTHSRRARERTSSKPTIVLVHGAFTDGSSWQELIPLLLNDGFDVVAVQNPLTSLANDIATTRRAIDAQQGPVVVVGQAYGGAVITGAAAANPNVKSLVYVAAFAPDANESVGALLRKYPSQLGPALRADAAGFLNIDVALFREVLAADAPLYRTRVMAVEQKPLIASALDESVSDPAWKTIPSWYIVAKEDQALNPALQRFYASRMKATTIVIPTSHVPSVSRPDVVAKVIRDAAESP
jgi:pimeloyl-ACP methyl ester carboxylesterase